MRLWSCHPEYLDAKGLVALWRETLLAQNVLLGLTKGYRSHPQLERFKGQKNPVKAMAYYLSIIHDQSVARGYNFQRDKIRDYTKKYGEQIKVSKGQIMYEFEHLKKKLKVRDPEKYRSIIGETKIRPHPLFVLTSGGIADWERVSARDKG